MQQKTFYNTLLEMNLDPKKVKQRLADKRLTNIEKKILESYLLIRNNQNSEALVILNGLPQSDFPFVEAQKKILIGVCLNNQSHFTEAEASLLEALPPLKSLASHYFLFVAHFNLFFIYFNTRQTTKMLEAISVMESIPQETELQAIRILRCQFNYYSEINDSEKARAILKKIEPQKKDMPESDSISQLVFEFMFYIKEEDFEKCNHVLSEMKKFRKFHLTENYNFMKKLLQHLTEGGPIYAYQEEFQNVPVLFHQIKVIQALEEKNLDLAKTHWDFLKAGNNQTYQNDFNYTGTKCLFSLCLNKHQQNLAEPIQFKLEEGISKVDSLITLLHEAKSPLPAAMIFEMLWGQPPMDKGDIAKLTRLVYRAKIEKKVSIQFRKGTYGIKSPQKTATKAS